jgi:hypothetical protein
MKRHAIFSAPRGHFTACMARISLLINNVEREAGISGFAPGFFEGKPRGKQTNNKHLRMN